ncbi:MAG TPA: hypothetical protein VF950_25655 [Planctomycetota bacterium]
MIFALFLQVAVDLSRHDDACGVKIERKNDVLRASWDGGHAVEFSLEPGRPLLASLEANGAVVARGLAPRFRVTTGSRVERPNERYIFFDKPAKRPTSSHDAALELKTVRAESAGARTSISFSALSAGPFRGELIARIYSGSPLIQLEAAMSLEEKLVAYIYDFTLEGDVASYAWMDTSDRFARVPAGEGEAKPIAVRRRTMIGETAAGAVAVFPPPHAFFFPRDHSDNFQFAQAGGKRFGLRQDPDRKNAFVPWIDAPAGRAQRMSAFLLVHAGKAEEALERVGRYTRGDTFAPMEGRLTFTSHWHVRLTVAEMAGTPRAPEVARVMKSMGVNLVHLAEFHGDGSPGDPGPKRLPELKAMFDLCRKYSDDALLFIPGEEANAHLNHPAPKGTHAGHWLYLFPKPVYLTLVRDAGAPFEETIAPYGKVYHAGSEADMVEILKRENALAWTAHPRIKASFACPDSYKDKDWFKSDLWLGGAWKSMPADLSHPRLGVRVLDLLDDMNTWGRPKISHGEVDTFELDRTHELYGHMNVNYLRLAKKPTVDDWSPVLDCLRRGDFFVTTGEVLIHAFDAKDGHVSADLEWTFPLRQVELAWWDGANVRRRTIPLDETREGGRRAFRWPLDLNGVRWVRLEAWDVATNGAFTQPLWIAP